MLALNPATGTNGAILYFNNSGSGGLNIGRSDSAGAGSGTTITAYDSFVATTGTTGLSFHTNNTRAMYIDSGQNVGIGTASPKAKLQINPSSLANAGQWASAGLGVYNPTTVGTYSQLVFGYQDGTITNAASYIGYVSTNSGAQGYGDLVFGTRSVNTDTQPTERMRIDSSGNVGIGTTSPTTVGGVALCVYDSSAPRIRLTNSTTGNTSTVGGELTIAGSDFIMENRTASANIRWYNNGSERMRLDSSGNVGIGATPNAWGGAYKALQIGGGASGNFLNFQAPSQLISCNAYYNGSNYVYQSSNYAGISDFNGSSAGGFSWRLAASGTAGNTPSFTQAMTLNSSGQVLVGTTTAAINSEIFAIQNGGGGSVVMRIQRSGQNAAYLSTDNSNIFGVYDSGIVSRFYVTSAGSCQNTTGSYGTISDAKLKENIIDATPKLAELMQVKVRNYGLKSEPNSKFLGFIAQELREIFPSMIEETPDEDENGEPTGEVTLGIKTTVFVPILVKAIQELNAKVTALEAK
jgi:hypothetical protein